MPELPEVETVCRIMRRALVGKELTDVEVVDDPIVLSGAPNEMVRQALLGARVTEIGRKGKFWWICTDREQALCGHLGMAGWIRELGKPSGRLLEHGDKPLDDEEGRPRFLKLRLTADDGATIVFTDGRRLGRLWLAADPEADPRIAKLGPDAFLGLPTVGDLEKALGKRSAPIKALLLDQVFLSGIGNYLADEVLYQSRIAPKRAADTLTKKEVAALRDAIVSVLRIAVESDADFDRLPREWLVHHRWGGKRGKPQVDGQPIVRETVGGRTTAWVPARQH